MSSKTKKVTRRQWIISLGFSEADADNFINLGLADWKIEKMAERHKLEQGGETEPGPPDEGQGFGDYLCPQCHVVHKAGSKIHKRHLKYIQ